MEFTTWRDVLQFLVVVVIGILGVPITQAFKNYFHLEDKGAVILTAIVSGVLALLELWLSGQVDFADVTLRNFPELFGLIFAVGTIYYHIMKDNKGVLGQRFMIKQKL
jgi:hypothetical protein